MNSQVVLCQGLNDEEELDRTISDLGKFIPHMESLSVCSGRTYKVSERDLLH